MISYKRDVLERQSLSEVKMFLNVKLQRLCKSHHLQCITSSKASEKLEKSLCVRDKAADLCWMPVVFGPSHDTASLNGMIMSLTLLNGPRIGRKMAARSDAAAAPGPKDGAFMSFNDVC